VESKKGLTITYFGSGKGKTTSAIGLALRSVGSDKKVRFIQFIKGGWKSSEEEPLKELGLDIEKMGLGFVGINNDKIKINKHKKAAREAFNRAEKYSKQSGLFLLVLDEILGAVKAGFISEQEVCDLIDKKKSSLNIVLTGRPKYLKIISSSDLVTEFKEIKHPFTKGELAKKGIDF
jgi:cob(I)alamin adenosyltransferase